MAKQESTIPLAKIVDELRAELITLRDSAEGKGFKFNLDEVEVELKVGVTYEGGGKIAFKCWIYEAEGGASVNRETVQTVKLKLSPTEPTQMSRGG